MSRNSRDDRRYDRDRDRERDREKERKKRRKKARGRSCWVNCLITLVVLLVITAGALYGGGYFAWKTYAEPNFGISFNDALGLIGSTYIAKEKDIVTKPFEEKDLNDFYTGLSDVLFLDSSVNLRESLNEVLVSVAEEMTKKDSSADSGDSGLSTEGEEAASGSITGNEALDNFLKELKFDFSRLETYTDEYATPYILSLTDKQTAAFLDNTLDVALSTEAVTSQIPEALKDLQVKDVVDVPQVIISNETVNGLNQTALTLTVRINLRDTVKTAAASVHKALSAAAFLVPKKLYATITIYPDDYLREAKIKVNSFSDEKMNNAYSIANYFLKGTEYGSVGGILQMVNQKAIEALEKVRNIVPVEFIDSSMTMSPIKAMMNALGATEVTETQFFCMVRDLCLPNFDKVKATLGFDENATEAAILEALSHSKDDLAAEISSKFALDSGFLTGDNMLDKLKGVGDENSDLIDHVRLANLEYTDESYIEDNAKVNMAYNGLAAIVGGVLNEKDTEATTQFNFDILNCKYNESTKNLALILRVGVRELITSKMGSDSPLIGFISQIVPEYLYLRAEVCLEEGSTADASIAINNRDASGTQELLNTIGSLLNGMQKKQSGEEATEGEGEGSEESSSGILGMFDTLSTTVATSVRDGIKNLNEQLGVDIKFKTAYAQLPSIYEIMANKILYNAEEPDNNLTPAEVYKVFKEACVIGDDIAGTYKAESLSRFTGDVNTKYAIMEEHHIVAPLSPSSPTIVDQLKGVGENYNSYISGNTLATNWSTSSIANKETRMKQEFNPYATTEEAATIFEGAFTVSGDGVSNVTLNRVIVLDGGVLELIYSCEYNKGDKYANVLPNFVINVKIDTSKIGSVDIENPDTYCASVTINGMSEEVLEDFKLMCQRLGITEFDMSSVIRSANQQINDGLKDMMQKVQLTLDKTNQQIYFGSLFELAYKNVHTDEAYVATDIADTIAALHTPVTQNGLTGTGASPDFTVLDKYSGTPSLVGTTVKASLTAKNLGAAVLDTDTTAIRTQLGITSNFNVFQVALLDLDTSDVATQNKNNEIKQSLSSILTETTGDYIAATFSIETSGINYTSTLMPENIYLTAMINNSTGDIKVAYNNLTDDQLAVLKSLAKGSADDAFDATGLATKMKAHIEGVKLFTYGVTDITLGMVLTANKSTTTPPSYVDEVLVAEKIAGTYEVNYTLLP